MNDNYQIYLNSQAWAEKRDQRLTIAGHQCEACGVKYELQVHHLTYERIFKEEMRDLLVLCKPHHKATEELITKGVIPRFGCVEALRKRTLHFIAPAIPQERGFKIRHPSSRAVEMRKRLMLNNEFQNLLLIVNRKEFKRACRKHFAGHPSRPRILANALMLFDNPNLRIL